MTRRRPNAPVRLLAAASLLPALALATPGCGGDGGTGPDPTPTPEPARLEIAGGDAQAGLVGVPFTDSLVVRVTDDTGAAVEGVTVRWETNGGVDQLSPSQAETDRNGRAMALWTPAEPAGDPDTVRARVGTDLVATFTGTPAWAEDGELHLGRNTYIEYRVGGLPIIISAPHGGTRDPDEIPDRTQGTMVRDTNTDLVARALESAFVELTGMRPHLIIATIHRRKVDLNREIQEAAQGNPLAEHAWHEFQGSIEHARDLVEAEWGEGFFVDLHGHGHDIQRLELGYLLSSIELQVQDDAMNQSTLPGESSLRSLAEQSPVPFAELLRGPGSLGTRFEALGFPAVPSAQQPHPGTDPYFTGGYNTARHGSRDGGPIDGVQIETHWEGARNTAEARTAYAAAIAEAVVGFMEAYYGMELTPAAAPGRE